VDKAQKVIDRAQKASSRLEFETRVEPRVEPRVSHRDGSEVQPIQEPGEMSPEDLEIMRQLSEAE